MDAALFDMELCYKQPDSIGTWIRDLKLRILDLVIQIGNASPKCHFVTYYSHFRVLGNLANISVLNRGKTAKENGNFDY